MLKLADLVFRGAEESPPKVTIHIPRTPVVEMTPSLPSPLLGSKAGTKSKRLKIPVPGKATGGQSPLVAPFGKIKIPSVPVKPETVASPPPLPMTFSSPPAPLAPTLPAPLPESLKPAVPKKGVAFATPKLNSKQKIPPPKKAKPVQGQSGGMSANDYRASRSALKKLQANKHARLFAQPVDPVRDNAPKYAATPLYVCKSLMVHLQLFCHHQATDRFELDTR